MNPMVRVGIGQDSHRFLSSHVKVCKIGGIVFEGVPGFDADSDGDPVLHAICNAISSVSGVSILGGIAIDLCHHEGITDSQIYLEKALETLRDQTIQHIALTIEGKKPRMEARLHAMKLHLGSLLKLSIEQVGITVTSGDGLTDFGRGEGIQCLCIITTANKRR